MKAINPNKIKKNLIAGDFCVFINEKYEGSDKRIIKEISCSPARTSSEWIESFILPRLTANDKKLTRKLIIEKLDVFLNEFYK